jgi:hypothetical protein
MDNKEFLALQNSLLEEMAQVNAQEAEKEELTTIRNEATRAKTTNAIRAEKAREYLDPVELVQGLQSLLIEADGADSEGIAALQFKLNVYKELLRKVLPDLKALEVKTEGARGSALHINLTGGFKKSFDVDDEKVVN